MLGIRAREGKQGRARGQPALPPLTHVPVQKQWGTSRRPDRGAAGRQKLPAGGVSVGGKLSEPT